jgi:hypothetical protein
VTTATTWRLRTRFMYLKLAAIQCRAIKLRNDLFHFLARAKLDESEPAGAARSRIPDDTSRSYLEPLRCEKLLKTLVRRVKRQISYI